MPSLALFAFKNFKVELMEAFRFIQTRVLRNYTCGVNDSPLITFTIIIAFALISEFGLCLFGRPSEG